MENLLDFVKNLHNSEYLKTLVQSGGIVVVSLIVFAETGLLAGFFLPGDSLLITAGIFTSSNGFGGPGLFNLWAMLGFVTVAAVVGDQVGFMLGRKAGKMVFQKKESKFFKKKHFDAAHKFYEQHGGKAIIIARFSPFLRTFVPFAAGVSNMNYQDFVKYNIVGGVLWVFSMVLLGHFLGTTPLANELHKIIIVVVFVSLLPVGFSVFKAWRSSSTASEKA